jgi:hypothetical protein
MAKHEVEVTISKTGEVRVHVKGAKGKACTDYVKWLQQIVGKVKDLQYTSEHYEPDVKTRIELHNKVQDKG